MDVLQAVKQLRPGTTWNLRGEKLEQVEDGTPRVTPPSQAEIKAILQDAAYQDQRAAEYPAIADQLDALWKGGDDAKAMSEKIRAIKDKYPKPAQ